jgi:hypothetical protein
VKLFKDSVHASELFKNKSHMKSSLRSCCFGRLCFINTELCIPNVPAELVPPLFHIREAAGSSIFETNYPCRLFGVFCIRIRRISLWYLKLNKTTSVLIPFI